MLGAAGGRRLLGAAGEGWGREVVRRVGIMLNVQALERESVTLEQNMVKTPTS